MKRIFHFEQLRCDDDGFSFFLYSTPFGSGNGYIKKDIKDGAKKSFYLADYLTFLTEKNPHNRTQKMSDMSKGIPQYPQMFPWIQPEIIHFTKLIDIDFYVNGKSE